MTDSKKMNEGLPDGAPLEPKGSVAEYLDRAKDASESGDPKLGMYLYLAAFEKASNESDIPCEDALFGLKRAWGLACDNKERSLAEYIFEKMEPYLSSEEVASCANRLQSLALDKLEEFGMSRQELESMAQMISEDLLNIDDGSFKIEHIATDRLFDGNVGIAKITASKTSPELQAEKVPESSEDNGSADESTEGTQGAASAEKEETGFTELRFPFPGRDEHLDYDHIAGYGFAIADMNKLGIGVKDKERFNELVELLNARHGLSHMPALDTIIFSCEAREDANRFMMATVGELALPAIHMHMEENIQGMPVLCISAQAKDLPKSNSMQDVLSKGGILLLEDLDMWSSPVMDMPEDNNAFIMMQLTRGAREAMNMLKYAADNPHVFVFATATDVNRIDPFFLDALEPITVVEIGLPTPEERVEIWMDISRKHPSMRGISKTDLVRLSANMPRFDIYMAAREAVDQAYKYGLATHSYKPVTRENIYEKLAAYQPLESSEYDQLENEVVKQFKSELDHLEDILDEE